MTESNKEALMKALRTLDSPILRVAVMDCVCIVEKMELTKTQKLNIGTACVDIIKE